DKLARQLGESFDQVKVALEGLERRCFVWHKKRSRTYLLVEPLNVLHERVYRTLERVPVMVGLLGRDLVLEREQIALATDTADEQTLSKLIDQWKQAGVLAPA